jgi:c-di-GMP-binding flagellar brake protein YcgR
MFERTYSFWRRLVGKSEPARTDEDRRLWVRHPANLTTTVQPTNNGRSLRLSARIRDISRGGIHLLVDHSFESGQLITIELPLAGSEQMQFVLACIVRVTREPGGHWALGCIFSQELTDDILAQLGGKRVKHEESDKRTWMRFVSDVHARIQSVGDIRNESYHAKVLNVSASGVGLQVEHRIEAGVLLNVDFLDQDEAVRRTILACVVHVSPGENGQWSLGCNFIRSLSEGDLVGLVQPG